MLNIDHRFKEELLEKILDNAYEWIVVVDHKGFINYLNKGYCEFLGVRQEEVLGKHVADIIENTRMHIVVQTGQDEIADLQFIHDNYMIANRIPIRAGNKIIGALGTVIYRDTKEWQQINTHIRELLSELEYYRKEFQEKNGVKYTLADLIGESEKMNHLKDQVKKVASGDVSILIRGESGTGKELIAHSIHQLSERSHKPFVKVNCGAIPEHLLESELFGYTEGAFTGAKKGGKIGKFQLADGGTIFLDEIGDMPLHMQVKLLRVLQEKEVERVGSVYTEKVDVRIVAATNRPLEKMVNEKSFREDLFYRINVIQLNVPPLRERKEDIGQLARYFQLKTANRTGKRITTINPSVLTIFYEYPWPGNIRELENVIEASVHLTNGNEITIDSLPDYLKERRGIQLSEKKLQEILEEAEKQAITAALQKHHNDKLKAAAALGIGKSNLYNKIKKYSL
ncbi:sigma-54 interaction domain-containing protein [Bacillus taeanensis]|uniref:Sigma-54-dependent Fis family transcriptional regulator n=1 Tax=Bacillus taeanensis TaxID=273032 RepID=A0A366XTK1_9BACI|nr:sigma 54-interacting transcriptional regulator [Bacillus taeanensis]RBW69227.1 sigma-54-dependent Fis family transcriptional regulator [Bacillus taeanensis]